MIAISGLIRCQVVNNRRPRLTLFSEDRGDAGQKAFTATVIALMVLSAAFSLVRIGDVDLAGHMLAYGGELSFATIFFLAVTLGDKLRSGVQRIDPRSWHGPQWVWAVSGVAIYAVALSGRGPDVYSLGYGSSLAWIGLAISAAAALGQRWLIASLSLGIVLAWQFRLNSSVNLWDYAIDPFTFVGSIVQTSARVCGTCVRAGTKWYGGRKLEDTTIDVVSKAA